jgi:carbon monoxide dehydrogenase subunit G
VIRVERTFAVSRSPDVVVEYLRDFTHAEEWDPGTKSCVQVTPGPVAVGTRWRNVSELRGRETELSYELTRSEGDHLTFVGRNKTATSTDDITVRPSGTGSTVTYRAEIVFHGLAKIAQPLLSREFERLADSTRDQLTRTIAGLPG